MAKELMTLGGIAEFFKDDLNSISKGELKFKSDFVLEFRIVDHSIHAKVRASMKDKSYYVKLVVDGEGGISEGKCECPRGNWLCSHMAATAIYANKKGLSKTDLPNSWIARPKKAAKVVPRAFADVYPSTKPAYKAVSRSADDSDKEFLHASLANTGIPCPFQWITGPEPIVPVKDSVAPPSIEDLLQVFLEDEDLFVEKCKVSNEQIVWLAENTTMQRKSQLWGQHRRLRLTGSNFGEVIKACQRNAMQSRPFPPSLFKKLMGEYSLGTKDSIMWGQMHEDVAIKAYEKHTGNVVKQAGLYLFVCGFLGSSPDGIIETKAGGKGVLEVKCPWKHRDNTIDKIIEVELNGKEEKGGFYLTSEKKLTVNHNYWHQVQAEMVAVGVNWAHFVVWTTQGMEIVLVNRDNNWEQYFLPILKQFYLHELMPKCYTEEKI